MERAHRTVMRNEVIDFLDIKSGELYLDMTFGEGGHTEAVLDKGGRVHAFDRDTQAIESYRADGRLRDDPRLMLTHCLMSEAAARLGTVAPSGVIADLGVSTKQILSSERGFSFQNEGPLDMRMDPTDSSTLAEVLENIREEELASALFHFGEVKGSRRLAARLLSDFEAGRLKTTADLVRLVPGRPGERHPATQLFMALRMLVNRELEEIDTGFPALFDALRPGGRFCAITFHSVEDRVVKRIFKKLAGHCICEQTPCLCPRVERGRLLTKKPLTASPEELFDNPRARSAKLRCIEKLPSTN